MGVDSHRVSGRLKWVRVTCDSCGKEHFQECVSFRMKSINKCLNYLESKGWDASRYFPGDIFCPDCVSRLGVKRISPEEKVLNWQLKPN